MDEKVFASSEDGKYHVWRPRDERLNPEYVVPWKRSGILTLGLEKYDVVRFTTNIEKILQG